MVSNCKIIDWKPAFLHNLIHTSHIYVEKAPAVFYGWFSVLFPQFISIIVIID
jgi:hypothetical protein